MNIRETILALVEVARAACHGPYADCFATDDKPCEHERAALRLADLGFSPGVDGDWSTAVAVANVAIRIGADRVGGARSEGGN